MLPAGPSREPPSRLDRVNAVLDRYDGCDSSTRTPRFASSPYLGECRNLATGETLPIDDLAERFEGNSFRGRRRHRCPGKVLCHAPRPRHCLQSVR
ncbi:MAG: hypothetical protein V8S69_07135 [Dakarella massiliensis]